MDLEVSDALEADLLVAVEDLEGLRDRRTVDDARGEGHDVRVGGGGVCKDNNTGFLLEVERRQGAYSGSRKDTGSAIRPYFSGQDCFFYIIHGQGGEGEAPGKRGCPGMGDTANFES